MCLSESPGKNYRQIYGKSKASLWRNLSTGTRPPIFFNTILCLVALVYNPCCCCCFFFFRTAVLRKLFDIRFSYKHCNFFTRLPTRQDGVENRDKVYKKDSLLTCISYIQKYHTRRSNKLFILP